MICKVCGKETPNNSNFCSHCGRRIDLDDILVDSNEEKSEVTPKIVSTEDYLQSIYPDIDLGKASILWYFLGLFVPMAGLIAFFIFLYKKPDAAFKARKGAIHGFLLNVTILFIFYIYIITKGGA